jgi:hypothetical protein
MLQGSMFGDAMGRDIMPDMYPPLKKAGALYARGFLRLLGVDEDDASIAVEHDQAGTKNGDHAVTGTKRRSGKGKPARPPRGT